MGEAFDFSGPFFKASIVADPSQRDSTRFPLWTFGSNQVLGTESWLKAGDYGMISSLAFLSEVTVKLSLSGVPTLTAVLTPPFEAARQFIESPLITWTRSILEVEFGYASPTGFVQSPRFEGLILKPEVTLGEDVSITLNAQGTGALSGVRQSSNDVAQNKSLMDVFDTICKRNQMELDIDILLASSNLLTNSDDALTAFTTPRESVVQQDISDWYFMVREAHDIGCWIYLDSSDGHSKLVIVPKDGTFKDTPQYTFRLFDFPGGVIGPKNGVFPIMSFSTPTSAIYLAGATQSIRLHGYDPNTREAKKQTVNDASATPGRSDNKQIGLAPESGQAPIPTLLPIDAGSPEAQQLAEGVYRDALTNMGIKIEVGTIGIPNLRPGHLIQIVGISPSRIDGKYVVFEVTHTLGSSGFDTHFVAYSNVGQLSSRVVEADVPKNPNENPAPVATTMAPLDTTGLNNLGDVIQAIARPFE